MLCLAVTLNVLSDALSCSGSVLSDVLFGGVGVLMVSCFAAFSGSVSVLCGILHGIVSVLSDVMSVNVPSDVPFNDNVFNDVSLS